MKKKLLAIILMLAFVLSMPLSVQAEQETEKRIIWQIDVKSGSTTAVRGQALTTKDSKYKFISQTAVLNKISFQQGSFELRFACTTGGRVIQINGTFMTVNSNYKWHKNSAGWWFGTGKDYAKDGFYLICNNKTNGLSSDMAKWEIYYFDYRGYMVSNQFIKGLWFGSNGKMSYYYACSWHKTGTGYWYGDDFWYCRNVLYWIDEKPYRFNSRGYLY